MNKRLWPLLLALTLLLTACGGGEDNAPAPAETTAAAADAAPVADVVQMDIAGLSDTMAYAQMFNVINSPKEYVGTSVRVKGTYVPIPGPTREGLYYHFLVVADITACCEVGVEFFLEDHRYPEDYPAQYAQVELTGVFDLATVSGQQYICLKVDEMKVL
ncbi:MAG: hypothetical protein GX540_06265 [Clostridiales bacterium]|nr:hypothetical protein [Clostridiales bacterium]